jgi:hypothetical protein
MLEVALGDSDVFLIRVVGLFVAVALITASSNGNLMEQRTLHLLCGRDTEDVLQLAIHLIHPIDRVCGQSV